MANELKAWNPGWIDWAQDKFAGLYGDYKQGMRDARKVTDLFNYAPVAGEAIDLAGFNDALREGNYRDAGLYAAGAVIPFVPGRKLVEALKTTAVRSPDGSPLRVFHGTDAEDFTEFKTPSFFTEHADEASAYSFWSDAMKREQALKNRVPTKLTRGDVGLHKQRIPYSGIFSDFSPEHYGKIVATDNGVGRLDADGKLVELFDNLKVNYKGAWNDEGIQVLNTKKSPGAREALREKREFFDKRYPPHVGANGRVYPVYLNIQNPIELPPFEANRLGKRLGADPEEVQSFIADLEKKGYDGIQTLSDEASLLPGLFGGQIPRQWIPFSPDQIVPATAFPKKPK